MVFLALSSSNCVYMRLSLSTEYISLKGYILKSKLPFFSYLVVFSSWSSLESDPLSLDSDDTFGLSTLNEPFLTTVSPLFSASRLSSE
jgi:hypothetical protein